jgi:hypothetical protein
LLDLGTIGEETSVGVCVSLASLLPWEIVIISV